MPSSRVRCTIAVQDISGALLPILQSILSPDYLLVTEPGHPADLILVYETDQRQISTVLHQTRSNYPHSRIILLTHWPSAHKYSTFAALGVFTILGPEMPFFAESLRDAITAVENPASIFDLRARLGSEGLARELQFHTKAQFQPTLETITNFLSPTAIPNDRLWELRLTLEEMINNALYHGFRDRHNHDKYSPESFLGLYDHDAIEISIGFDSKRWAIAVCDNAGTLEPLSLCHALDRQISRAGVMDSRGRGLFIMRRLSDRMMVNLEPGGRTQVQLYFNRDLSPAWKALELNILPPPIKAPSG